MTLDLNEVERLAARGDVIAYFGYGSLVNPATHRTEIVGYVKAGLCGWRREWKSRGTDHVGSHPVALLSSSPHSDNAILPGLLVFDHAANLPALDIREAGYDRRELTAADLDIATPVPAGCPIYVYEGQPQPDSNRSNVILQSYLDAVLQGYFVMYGAEGVDGFVRSTARFDTPLLRDRETPNYPRAVTLTHEERDLIDRATAALSFIDA
ncbi:MAG: gamma-glutamylcyclotransferase family protein [Pseudomonadota bacterium]